MALRGLDLRDGVEGLVRRAELDLSRVWREVRDAAEAETALRDVLPALIAAYGEQAGALAAMWYDDLRDKVGVRGAFAAFPAEIPDPGAHALVGWAVTEAKDTTSLRTLVQGGMQRRIQNYSRQTVAQSSVADPGAVGWKRIGAGACSFCLMLIQRDETYRESTADFASHDHCGCSAYPLLKGAEPIKVKDYVQTDRTITDADRKRVRDWLRDNPPQGNVS